MRSLVMVLLLVCLPSLTAIAANPCDNILDVEKHHDITGDGIVDAADWAKMSNEQRQQYVRAAVTAAGSNPDALAAQGETRAQHYFRVLEHLYR